jgi:AAA+ superfamily predicted ATPase
MSEIKISIQNKSSKEVSNLNDFANKVAAKVAGSFANWKPAVEAISIVIDATEQELANALMYANKKYLLMANVPENQVEDATYQSKIVSLRARLLLIELDDKEINNVFIKVAFVAPSTTKTAVDEEKEDAEKRVQSFVPVQPKYSLDKVIMSKEMRMQIEDALSILRNRKKIYEEWGFSEVDPQPKAILSFWGPPGTGKTMCAQALAHEMGVKVLSVNYSEIESKYMGESPKNLDAAFKSAKENNALLFFDEADSFLGKRITNVQQSSDQAINSLRSEMLKRLEEFEGIVIFATNLVKNFDQAFQTRILKHIKFDLPNQEARTEIYKTLIPSKCPLDGFTDETYDFLSQHSDGFSGRDIRNTVLDTLSNAAKENKDLITLDNFLCAVRTRQEAYKKLQEDTKFENDKMADDIRNSIIEQSQRDFNAALVHIALHAAWAEGELAGAEEALILELAKSLGVKNPPVEQEYLTPLSKVCEYFQTKEQKYKAIDIACRVIVIDGQFYEKEKIFIQDLCSRLNVFADKQDSLIDFISDLANNNQKWIELTK